MPLSKLIDSSAMVMPCYYFGEKITAQLFKTKLYQWFLCDFFTTYSILAVAEKS
jgi:hypothetical protein